MAKVIAVYGAASHDAYMRVPNLSNNVTKWQRRSRAVQAASLPGFMNPNAPGLIPTSLLAVVAMFFVLPAAALESNALGVQAPQAAVELIVSKIDALALQMKIALSKIQACNKKGAFFDPEHVSPAPDVDGCWKPDGEDQWESEDLASTAPFDTSCQYKWLASTGLVYYATKVAPSDIELTLDMWNNAILASNRKLYRAWPPQVPNFSYGGVSGIWKSCPAP